MLTDKAGPLAELSTRIVESPLIWLLLILVALATASALARLLPWVRGASKKAVAGRQASIDGLRGVLGISVFVNHTVITWFFLHGTDWRLPPSRSIVHAGQTGVALFFMITAFLFWGRVLDKGNAMDWPAFFVSRIYRLYPVYLLMLAPLAVTAFALAPPGDRPFVASIVRPLLDWLLFTMFSTPDIAGFPRTWVLVAGVVWTLPYEWMFYLALPLLAFCTGRGRPKRAAVMSAIAVFAICVVFKGRASKFAIFELFFGGIAAAYWVRVPKLKALGRGSAAGIAAVAALAAVVTCLPTAYSITATLGLTVFFIVIASGHDLWGALRLPGLLWLGDITYSIYLLHGFLLWALFQYGLPRDLVLSGPVFIVVSVVSDVALVAVSSLIFLTIEQPCIAMGKRHYRLLEQCIAARRLRRSPPANSPPGAPRHHGGG